MVMWNNDNYIDYAIIITGMMPDAYLEVIDGKSKKLINSKNTSIVSKNGIDPQNHSKAACIINAIAAIPIRTRPMRVESASPL